VAAGDDYTLVLTSATIPTLPYDHLLSFPVKNKLYEKMNSIVVVMGKVGDKGIRGGVKVDEFKDDSNLGSVNNSDSDNDSDEEHEANVIPCELSSNFNEKGEMYIYSGQRYI
jgi:hypothetical protein